MQPKKVIFDANYALRLSPKSGLWKEYGYEIIIDQPDQASKKFHGKSTILFKRTKENRIIAELTMSHVFINNKAPDLTLEILADEIREIINPIDLLLNSDGSIETVTNLPQIKQRFQNNLPKLKQYFQSKIVDEILKSILGNLENPSKFLFKLKQNPIIELLFPMIYLPYTEMLKQNLTTFYHSFDLNYSITQLVEEHTTRSGKVNLLLQGKRTDELAENKLIQNQKNIDFNLKIKLNPIDKTIYSIEGDIKNVDFKQYKIGIYELNTKMICQQEIFTLETKESTQKNQKTWWNLLKNYQPKL
jgi:hypothetical protein